MKIPDYISPVVACRVWRWGATGLQSLNGEPWLPGRPLVAACRLPSGTTVHRTEALHSTQELPHPDCSCGVYAAKSIEHLREFGYAERGAYGEVYLWGTVVEHKLGWRAQSPIPKVYFCRLPSYPSRSQN
jgi:hypothetical protein